LKKNDAEMASEQHFEGKLLHFEKECELYSVKINEIA
jgi:hypothetical protein